MGKNVKEIVAESQAAGMVPVFTIPMRRLGSVMGISFTSSSTREERAETVIDERRYRIADCYKVELRALDSRFGSQSFYISDLEGLMRGSPSDFTVENRTPEKVNQLRVAYKARNVCHWIFDFKPTLQTPESDSWLRDALVKEMSQRDDDVSAFCNVADLADKRSDAAGDVRFDGIASLLRQAAQELKEHQAVIGAAEAPAAR